MHYASNWDLVEVIQMSPALQSQPLVITTADLRRLERAVGAAPAIGVSGRDADLRRLLEAVELATNGVR